MFISFDMEKLIQSISFSCVYNVCICIYARNKAENCGRIYMKFSGSTTDLRSA